MAQRVTEAIVTTAPDRSPAPASSALGRVLVFATCAEALILLFGAMSMIGAKIALAAHAVVLVALASWYWRTRSEPDIAGSGFLAIILVTVAGPFGGVGALLLPYLLRYRTETPELLASWYERIALSVETDPLTQSSDNIAIGRSADLGAPPPVPFATLFSTGTVAARQAALGMIARRFHPEHLPALKTALASQEAIVRVQAAAVAAKIKPELDARVKARLADLDHATAPAATLAAAAELERCAASGLLPETDAARIRAAVAAATSRATARVDSLVGRGVASALTPEERAAYEDRLLAERRFADLRALRLRRRDRFMRRYRWRPLSVVARAAIARATGSGAR